MLLRRPTGLLLKAIGCGLGARDGGIWAVVVGGVPACGEAAVEDEAVEPVEGRT